MAGNISLQFWLLEKSLTGTQFKEDRKSLEPHLQIFFGVSHEPQCPLTSDDLNYQVLARIHAL